jgi:hypothetical protein
MTNTPNDDGTLFHVLLNTLQEVWVMKDRQIVLERVLEDNGIDVTAAVERLQPDAALSARIDAERKIFLDTVLKPLHPTDDT